MSTAGKRWFLATMALTALVLATLTGVSAGASTATCATAGSGAQLFGVAATSTTNAWAVGNRRGTAAARTLIEQWNGADWCRVPSPNPSGTSEPSGLNSVSATSATDAWAVGSFNSATGGERTLILHWDGTSWKRVASPDPSGTYKENFLIGVAAVSSSDAWAVGHYSTGSQDTDAMIVHWNGTSWSQETSPEPGPTTTILSKVTATSGSSAWAVGYYGDGLTWRPLVLQWDGKSWTQAASPDPGGSAADDMLNDVAATSASDAWAVGSGSGALILHWNGTGWTHVPSP